ncbi:MAG: acyl-CoA synthetase, partial [Streptosporangiales bacterium]|nr:acyl-CoA synthetase [Streptosporangiales bacterium]
MRGSSSPTGTAMTDGESSQSLIAAMDVLFAPRTIAVAGASTNKVTYGNIFIRRLRKFGFEGNVYPLHPTAETIEGVRSYRSFADMPEPIDYAYVAVPPKKVPDLLEDARGRLRFAHVISSGFGEVEEGQDLETRLVDTARQTGIRLLGPNCLGIHTPRGRVTFADPDRLSGLKGSVGIISQSGSLATDVLRRGTLRGVRFSGIVSVGNSADIGPNELLEFMLSDPATETIGIYLEDVKDGRRFFDILRAANARKPVILLVGGRTQPGQQAAASHTGALAQDDRVWLALARQTGAILTETLEEFIESLLIFQMCRPRADQPTREVTLFGNGGGISVIATDYFSRQGLNIGSFNDALVHRLEDLALPPGTSVLNPIDTPLGTFRVDDGRIAGTIVEIVLTESEPDAIVMH